MLEDYASVPLSSLRKDATYPPKIDFTGALGRVNVVRSEPADVPTSATRFFVIDNNGVLYILDKSAKTFTPYIDFGKIFPNLITSPGLGNGRGFDRFRSWIREERKVLHRPDGKAGPDCIPCSRQMPHCQV